MLNSSVAALLLLAGSAGSPATDGPPMTLKCPVDGTSFALRSLLLEPETGIRLDLRPTGTRAPAPLPRCPKCGYVIGRDSFKPDELDQVRPVLASPHYLEHAKTGSTHALQAVLLEALGGDTYDIAWEWLEASWELEDRDKAAWQQAVEKALDGFSRLASSPYRAAESFYPFGVDASEKNRTASLMRVELLRRLGRFDQATTSIEALRKRVEMTRGLHGILLERQEYLIRTRDTQPHEIQGIDSLDPTLDDPAFIAARALGGYASFNRQFELKGAILGAINFLPHSLFVDVEARNDRPVTAARWANLTEGEHPKFDWTQYVALHERVEKTVQKQKWLQQWKAAAPKRTIELQVAGLQPWAEKNVNFLVMPAWRHARFGGRPALEVLLRDDSVACGTLWFDEAGTGVLVTSMSEPCAQSQLPCATELFFHPNSDVPTYLRIRTDGTCQLRKMKTNKKRPKTAWPSDPFLQRLSP
jgi:hypothetical protein